jgi:hypothetical protein
MPEADQDAAASALERLIGAFMDSGATGVEADHAPALRPELAALVEESIREHAETLEYLKDR